MGTRFTVPSSSLLALQHIMSSATNHVPIASDHIRSSEICATCHTLITHSLGPGGEVLGEFPEQVPYLEWKHSSYGQDAGADTKSCQSCHMPLVDRAPISSVLPQPRHNVRRHVFRGGNFFMQNLLGRYGDELGVAVAPQEMKSASQTTRDHLAQASARLHFETAETRQGRLFVELAVESLTGHKLPTAYPSRRVWINLRVLDESDALVFESGKLDSDGSSQDNDNDKDGSRYEPHYSIIETSDQVQIYETILARPDGALTTGLLQATSYLKDNRILPAGFAKQTAEPRVAVHGRAEDDSNFVGGGDSIAYDIDLGSASGPYRVEAALLYQPIGFRWAQNLTSYGAPEAQRFVEFYESMSSESAAWLARASTTVD